MDWEGADFTISDICDTLRVMRAEAALPSVFLALALLPADQHPCASQNRHLPCHTELCIGHLPASAGWTWQSWCLILPRRAWGIACLTCAAFLTGTWMRWSG